MAYTGLLLLLLMSSSLLISTFSQQVPRNRLARDSTEEINKVKERTKKVGGFIKDHMDEIRLILIPFLAVIPVCGPLISAVVNTGLIAGSLAHKKNKQQTLETILSELDSIKSQMEKYHLEQKWNSWAPVYQKTEMHIKLAWDGFVGLLRKQKLAKDANEIMRHETEFLDIHQKHKEAVNTLHSHLTAKQPTFSENLGGLLAEHVKCHDREIREYTLFINMLIWKGNTVNLFYNKLKKIENKEEDGKAAMIAYDVAKAMFQIQMDCMNKSKHYVKIDIEALITKDKKHDDLANEVHAFLEQAYDRYDWMVVAYKTKKSDHTIRTYLNKHTTTDFYTSVQKDKTSVAVARQVKGNHTKLEIVITAIRNCIKKTPVCNKVGKILRKCEEVVENDIKVYDAITAVHAYIGASEESLSTSQESDDVESSTGPDKAPYIYKGDCKRSDKIKSGKFTVMIKSDEELFNKDPCANLDCGGDRGRCSRVEGIHMGICRCHNKYYGRNCESSIENYKNEILVRDLRTRNRPQLLIQ